MLSKQRPNLWNIFLRLTIFILCVVVFFLQQNYSSALIASAQEICKTGSNYSYNLTVQDEFNPEAVITLTSGSGNEFSLRLGEGWNLVSVPLWAEVIEFNGEDIGAWLVYEDGKWAHLSGRQALINALNNPAKAVYVKTIRPTQLRFRWAELTPERQFASSRLSPGWNLISSSLRADYLTILAGIRDDGSGGLTWVYAPNEFNERKEAGYHLPWPTARNSLTNPDYNKLFDMYPLDGYWVFLQGTAVTYSTPVGDQPPEKIN